MRIHHGDGRRHGLIGLVMVRHDDIHAELLGQSDFMMRSRPAVRGDQQRDALVMQPLYRGGVQAVPFPLAMRHIGPHIGAE